MFTDAMIELSSECTDKQREKIGKITRAYRKGEMPTHILKQRLWDERTDVDNYFFTDIVRAADFQEEQDIMAAYMANANLRPRKRSMNTSMPANI